MSKDENEKTDEGINYLALGLGLGMTFGTALGLVFGAALDNMGFMVIGIGGGLTLGLSIGTAMQERHKKDGA